ncbi:MAG: hypothetical protein ACOX6S_00850 [Clostridia bacterium]
MGVRLRKRIFLVVMASSLFLFVAACNEAPTAQPWERDMAAIQPVPVDNTPKPEVEESAGPKESQKTSELKPSPVTPKYVSVDKVKETAPARLEESFEMRGCTVNIDADVLVRTRDPQSCPIYWVEPFKYDPETIAKLVYGEEADEAMAYDKTVEKSPERPGFHHYRSGDILVTVDDHFMGMGNFFPRYEAVVEENQRNTKEVEVLPSGICDAISFSREEAIEKARAYLEPFQFPVDLDLPRVKACQWHGFQYYEIIFEHLYEGIPAYTNSFASFEANTSQLVLTYEYVSVQVCEEGVLSMHATLSRQTEIDEEYRQVIDFNTAYGLFKEYMYNRLAQVPIEEAGFTEIEFAYFPVVPKDYDGSSWMKVPCWIFYDPIGQCTVVINGLDGSLIKV